MEKVHLSVQMNVKLQHRFGVSPVLTRKQALLLVLPCNANRQFADILTVYHGKLHGNFDHGLMARSHCMEPGPGQVQGMGPGSMGFSILCLLFTLH